MTAFITVSAEATPGKQMSGERTVASAATDAMNERRMAWLPGRICHPERKRGIFKAPVKIPRLRLGMTNLQGEPVNARGGAREKGRLLRGCTTRSQPLEGIPQHAIPGRDLVDRKV